MDHFVIVCEPHFRHPPPERHTAIHLLEHVLHNQQLETGRDKRIMADLTNLTTALDQLGADSATATADVEAKLQELLDLIAGLSVGSITQAQIDELTAKAQAADAAVQAIDTAANAANPPA